MPEDEEEGGEGGTCSAAAVDLLQASLPFPSRGSSFCFSRAPTKGYARWEGERLDSSQIRSGKARYCRRAPARVAKCLVVLLSDSKG